MREGRGRSREVKLLNHGGEKKVERRTGDEEEKKESSVSSHEKRAGRTGVEPKEVTEDSPNEKRKKFPAKSVRVTQMLKGKGKGTKGIPKGKG